MHKHERELQVGRVAHGRLRGDRRFNSCGARNLSDRHHTVRVLPDLSARVNFTTEPTAGRAAKTRVLVPKSALTSSEGRSGVFRVVDGRAKLTPVTAGGDVQGQVEITQGLQGGERLISLPAGAEVRDGEKVRVEGQKD